MQPLFEAAQAGGTVESHIPARNLIWDKFSGATRRGRWRPLLLTVMLLGMARLEAAEPVSIGVLAPRGEAQAFAHLQPTLEQLNRALAGYQFSAIPLDLDALETVVAEGRVDFVITNPAQFVLLGTPHELGWLATPRSQHGGSLRHSVGAALLVRADSPFHSPQDLRGRPVGAVHPRAFGGYLLLHPRLAEQGIKPESAYEMRFLGYPVDTLLYALRDGALDAAMVPTCLLEDMAAEGLLQAEQFRALMPHAAHGDCLSSTPSYPGWSFAALPHVPEQLATAVARALLAPTGDGSSTWAAPVSPAQVATLLQELQLHPLQQPFWLQVQDKLRHYWHYVLLAALVMLAALAYLLWLQRLALRRSRELATAHLHLRERELELAAAQRISLLGELAASLAHELNQPLAAIRHYAEGCTVRLARESADHPLLPALARIDQEAARGAAVVEQVRRWLRREPPQLGILPLRKVVTGLLRLHELQIRRLGVPVEVRLEPPDLCARGNQLALEQVLSNLLCNSLQAYQERGCKGPITIEARPGTDGVSIYVRDEAGGFSSERLRQPFTPFRSTRPEGLGLGLLICQRLMQAQGGNLTLTNTPVGAEIHLSLPAEEA